MKNKAISGIMLTLLLTSMLTLAFNIQPVRASGTIYITSDYTFTHNVYEPMVVLADNIVVDGNGYTLQGTGSGIGIDVRYRSGVTIKNMKIKAFYHCIFVSGSSNNIIQGNNITSSGGWGIFILDSNYNIIFGNNITANNWGIRLQTSSNNAVSENNITNNNSDGLMLDGYSSHNTISDNNITNNNYDGVYLYRASNNIVHGNNIANNNWRGIRLHFSSSNVVSGNNITNNTIDGIFLASSIDNKIYHNSFVDNTKQVESHYSTNVWDDGYPSGGNYWSDYTDFDLFSGPNQDESGSDGIWDHPYVINPENQDNYPLVNPWTPTPPVVTATLDIDPVTLNMRSGGKWITAYIQLPEEYNPEDIDATSILLNETISPVLDPQYEFVTNSSEYLVDHNEDEILERMVKFNRTAVASWICNDLGIQYGNVTLTITGEVDGTLFEGTDIIKVLFPGDADDDGDVDCNDLYILSRCHGMNIENPSYYPLADFNEDGYINSEDLLIVSENYGKTA